MKEEGEKSWQFSQLPGHYPDSPAQGIGVQLLKNRKALATNQMVSLGRVGTSPVDLGLSATYATTGERLTAGPVQSVIGVTFVYP